MDTGNFANRWLMMGVGLVLLALYGMPHIYRLHSPVMLANGRSMQGLVMRRRNSDGTWAYRPLTPEELEHEDERLLW